MKKYLFVIVIGLLLVSIPLTVYFVGQRQELRKKAAPSTTLSLSPASLTKNVDDEFTLNVNIDPGSNQVIALDLAVQYDPTILDATSITSGPLFSTIISGQQKTGDTISISLGTTTTHPVTTSGVAAVVHFKAIAPSTGPLSISFPTTNRASALDAGSTNVLTQRVPATITVAGTGGAAATAGTPTPSPTRPAGTPTVTTTPGGTPTPSPTGTLGTGEVTTPSGELKLLLPANEATTSATPQLEGTGAPGSTVTITIYSEPQSGTVTVKDDGTWVFTPATPLTPGPHNIVITSTDANGNTVTTNATIVVAGGTGGALTDTENTIPESGDTSPTFILAIVGSILLLAGFGSQFLLK